MTCSTYLKRAMHACFAASLSFIFACGVVAGTIEYVGPDEGPDGPGGMTGWSGDTVWYAGVSETNEEGDGGDDGMTAMLFGPPASVSGDAIDFNPTFRANAEGPDSEIVDGQLNFMVVALEGQFIENIQFSEAGDTTLSGIGTGATTFTKVTAKFFIDVIAVDGSPLGVPLNITTEMDFVPVGATAGANEGRWDLAADGDGFSFDTIFSGSLFVDINQELSDAGIDFQFGATKLNVAVDNTLTAVASAAGYEAFIAKKDFDGLTVTSNIPEPTGLVLMATLIAGACVAGRRG